MMPTLQPSTLRLLRRLHRWFGLAVAALVIFYCITGLLLNHRTTFSYFIDRQTTVSRVPVSDTAVMRAFIDLYKQQIGRKDDPTVIRIRGSQTIEFLYGSHGKTTYIIDPGKGEMKRIEKVPRQPWSHLNRLHKVFKTSRIWLAIADLTCLSILLVTITGLFIFRYRPLDWLLVVGGILLAVLGIVFA
ncbi:MAG TPA: hypothetical protein ENK27_13785 [Desulfobulbus sp.]|nr:hypothetical protein [Desulfobulbus sp.]